MTQDRLPVQDVPGFVRASKIDNDPLRPLATRRDRHAVAVDANWQRHLAGDLELVAERAVVILAMEQHMAVRTCREVARLTDVRLAIDGGAAGSEYLRAVEHQ